MAYLRNLLSCSLKIRLTHPSWQIYSKKLLFPSKTTYFDIKMIGDTEKLIAPLIALFHHHEVLMKTLSLFVTNSLNVLGESIKMTIQEMELDTHVAPKITKSQQHSSNEHLIVSCLFCYQEIFVYLQ